MPVYWGVRWDLNPCCKEPQSSALPDWATNTVLMERLELSTTALWEQPSTIEVHQHIFLKDKELEWASKDLNLHYYLIRVASWPIRRHAHIAEEAGVEPTTAGFGDQCSTNELLPNYLVAGSGFAPLVFPLWVGQDYYFSNLLKHQIIDYFSLLHSENFQKWWHQVLQATWLNLLQRFLRDL